MTYMCGEWFTLCRYYDLGRVYFLFIFLNLAIVLYYFGPFFEGYIDCQYNTRMGWMREQIVCKYSIYIYIDMYHVMLCGM